MEGFLEFWAARIREHLTLVIPWVYKYYQIALSEQANSALQALVIRWEDASQKTEQQLLELADDTIACKTAIRERWTKEQVPCFPDLAQHMIEEVRYVKKWVTRTLSVKDEVKFWVFTHGPDVVHFASCVLSDILAREKAEATPHLRGVMEKAREAVETVKEIKAGLLSLQLRALDAETQKAKRLGAELVAHVRQLAKQQASLSDVADMLEILMAHEQKEVAFALARLRKHDAHQ